MFDCGSVPGSDESTSIRANTLPVWVVTAWPVTPGGGPEDITTGPDGNLWFTEFFGDLVGRITPSGEITEFTLPTPNSAPVGIVVGPDGVLWIAEYIGSKIARMDTNGNVLSVTQPKA